MLFITQYGVLGEKGEYVWIQYYDPKSWSICMIVRFRCIVAAEGVVSFFKYGNNICLFPISWNIGLMDRCLKYTVSVKIEATSMFHCFKNGQVENSTDI